jgi:hydrogenase maturation protease
LVTKDNAAGVLVVRALSNRKRALDIEHLLIVDAAEIDETPGTVKWIPEESIDGMSASTHSLTLCMLARYLTLELNCTVALLGIQPGSNTVGDDISSEVAQAVQEIVDELDESGQMVQQSSR